MDDYTREMMDLKTLVTRTLEKKGVLAKIRVFSFPFFLIFLHFLPPFPTQISAFCFNFQYEKRSTIILQGHLGFCFRWGNESRVSSLFCLDFWLQCLLIWLESTKNWFFYAELGFTLLIFLSKVLGFSFYISNSISLNFV